MELIMMISHSNKLVCRVLTCLFVVALALVIAFCPLAQSIAYANTVNQCFEVVGYVVAAVGGTFASKAIFAAAGITTTAILTNTTTCFVFLLVAAGISISVATLIHILTSEKSLDAFGVEFWRILSTCWDNTKMKFVCAAVSFKFLTDKVKSYFGLDVVDYNKAYTEFPYFMSNFEPNAQYYKDTFPFTSAKYDYVKDGITKYHTHLTPAGGYMTMYLPYDEICEYGKDCFPPYTSNFGNGKLTLDMTNKKQVFTLGREDGSTDVLSFKFYYNGKYPYAAMTPIVYKEGLYFAVMNYSAYRYYVDINIQPILNGVTLYDVSSFHPQPFYYDDNNKSVYLYVVFSDGTLKIPTSLANFFYLWLVKGGSVVHSSTMLKDVTSVEDLSDEDAAGLVTDNSYSHSIPDGTTLSTIRGRSKSASYSSTKDVVGTLSDKLTNVISGDVVIDASETLTGDISDTTDLSDVVAVTDVVADDVVITDTATGDPVNLPPDGFIDWILGLNLIKVASQGITEKFPFCIPSYIKEQVGILVAEPEEPIFKIPFQIQSADLKGDVEVDLTKFDTVIKITDFFLTVTLVIGLCFVTKKMFF